jgi:hypothetical protein
MALALTFCSSLPESHDQKPPPLLLLLLPSAAGAAAISGPAGKG